MMKTALKLAPLVLVALAAVALPAAARDHGRGHDRGNDRHSYSSARTSDRHDNGRRDNQRNWQRDDGRYSGDRRYSSAPVYRSHPRVYAPRSRYYAPRTRYYAPPHRSYYGPPAWARGRDYRSYGYSNVYYVPYNDYGRYGLYAPGYGHRWVRDDRGNFLLVAAATGIITSLLLNQAY